VDPRIVGLNSPANALTLVGMRSKRTHITLALALVVVSLAAIGTLGGPVATASAHTWHHRYSNLIVPAPTNFVACVNPRRIYLAGGQYRFHGFIHHTGHRPINRDTWTTGPRLAAGWYVWDDCLKPVKYGNTYIYHLTATLRHQRTGVTLYNDGLYYKGRYGSGRYHWGSVLDRTR
jgi:hypothetical protein